MIFGGLLKFVGLIVILRVCVCFMVCVNVGWWWFLVILRVCLMLWFGFGALFVWWDVLFGGFCLWFFCFD